MLCPYTYKVLFNLMRIRAKNPLNSFLDPSASPSPSLLLEAESKL